MRALLEYQDFLEQLVAQELQGLWEDLVQWDPLGRKEIREMRDLRDDQDFQGRRVYPMWRATG